MKTPKVRDWPAALYSIMKKRSVRENNPGRRHIKLNMVARDYFRWCIYLRKNYQYQNKNLKELLLEQLHQVNYISSFVLYCVLNSFLPHFVIFYSLSVILEYSRHHSQEYNRKLLEGIVKPSSPTFRASPFSSSNQPSSTRSVLDALKEISRKRIHTNEVIYKFVVQVVCLIMFGFEGIRFERGQREKVKDHE